MEKYPAIRELLEIPPGEPLFIVRGQDVLAPVAVAAYRALYNVALQIETLKLDKEVTKHFSDHLKAVEQQMMSWQVRHPSSVKFPD